MTLFQPMCDGDGQKVCSQETLFLEMRARPLTATYHLGHKQGFQYLKRDGIQIVD